MIRKFTAMVKKCIDKINELFQAADTKFSTYKRRQKILFALTILALPLVVFAAWNFYQITNPEDLFGELPNDFDEDEFDWDQWDVEGYFDKNIVNIVLLGFDRDEGRSVSASSFRTDTIKVFSINFDKEEISIINIPRDIYITIGDTSIKDKINHSYYHGYRRGQGEEKHTNGLEYTLKSISNVLGGIPLKYYVTIDMDAVMEIVDGIGGVEFTVEADVFDLNGELRIRKGHHILNGHQYLIYLRNRTEGGDLSRVNRQTELLTATLDHFQRQGLFKKVPLLYNMYQEKIETNMTAKQMISLLLYSRNLERSRIHSYTISGFNNMMDGVYYMTMDQAKRAEIIRTVFGIDFTPDLQETLTDTTPKPPKSFYAEYLQKSGQMGVYLSWEPGDRYNHTYNLYRRSQNGEEILLMEGKQDEDFWDMEVQTGTSYVYRLEAVNRKAVSESMTLQIEIKTFKLLKPTEFRGVVEDHAVHLTWKLEDMTATGFTLTRKGGGLGTVALLQDGLVYEYIDKDLPPGDYTYILAANYTAGSSKVVEIKVKVEADPTPDDPNDPDDPPAP